jgi:hypothetical protein
MGNSLPECQCWSNTGGIDMTPQPQPIMSNRINRQSDPGQDLSTYHSLLLLALGRLAVGHRYQKPDVGHVRFYAKPKVTHTTTNLQGNHQSYRSDWKTPPFRESPHRLYRRHYPSYEVRGLGKFHF